MGRPALTAPRIAQWATFGLVLVVLGCESIKSTPTVLAPGGERGQVAAAVPKKPGGVHAPLRVAKFVVYADVPLDPADVIFRELEELPDQLQRELRLPASNTIVQVFLFDDQEKYEAYMKDRYPWLPVRRAYFIADQKRPGSADDLQVYTYIGDHLRTDLRHELTHALLHSVLKGVPLWLDEGLAGFFEQPPHHDGVNPDHLDTLRKEYQAGQTRPDLPRLEKIDQVKQMGKAEYREAWAWVHFLLRSDPKAKAALLDYVQLLRENPDPGPLQAKLGEAFPEPNAVLVQHLYQAELPSARIRTAGR